MDGPDSTAPPSQLPDQGPSIAPPSEDMVSGEKRKRSDQPLDSETPNPDPTLHPLWKTSLCSYFRSQSGSCSHGGVCRYAHGEEELRTRPDNTWDPTSERAKKAMRVENGEKREVSVAKEEEILMTETVVDDEDGDGRECSESGLSKCLVHLPRKWNSDGLTKFLEEQGIAFKSAKKKKGMTVGFVSFGSAEQLKSAMRELEGKSIGNKNLKVADVIPRSFEKKPKSTMAVPHSDLALAKENAGPTGLPNGAEDGDPNDGSSAIDGSVLKARSARDVVTPLAHMPYSEQLETKKNSLLQILKKLTRNARKACPNGVSLPDWILKSREIGGLPCQLEGVVESPLVNGYRNKCEFSVGYSVHGKPTVGFMLGNFREGVTAVEEPLDCPNVSEISCKYASIFQDFLQHSGLPVWNRFKNTGFWRQLTVREGRTPGKAADEENFKVNVSEVMLIVQVCSVSFDNELITGEFERLAQAFAAGATENSPPLPLTALVIQDHKGISNAAPADAPLQQLPIPKAETAPKLGPTNNAVEPRIHDYINNLRFSISPTAFFQVNTLAAEKLYSLAGDWAGLGPDTLLFDVCCGTGTIGLTLAHRVGLVVGIEMNASAVSDAHQNAEINGIKNCRFVCAKAEDVMGSLLKEYLNVSRKQDEIPIASESRAQEITTDEEKGSSTDNVKDPEESSSHELKHSKDASGCSESVGEELGKERHPNTSESRAQEITTDEEKGSSTDNVKDPEESSSHELKHSKDASGCSESVGEELGKERHPNTSESRAQEIVTDEEKDLSTDNIRDTEESSSHELEHGKDASRCSENVGEGPGGQLLKNCTSEDGKTSVQQFKNVVAIVDPPRVGLHPIVIKALRTHPSLRRLVYISCNPESLVANAIELCTPSPEKIEKGNKNNRGWRNMSSAGLARHRTKSMPVSEPFRPVKAMAVDLFPHTPHCEMVMLLER